MSDQINKGISVVICCYNSSSRLYETLRHLSIQETGSLNWEIVLVDNASTDDTACFAQEIWQQMKRSDVGLKIVTETMPGLSFARERGVKEAAFDYIVFCDDDNWLDADYLQTAFTIMERDKTIAAAGGICYAASDTPLPVWFKSIENAYAVGPQADTTGFVHERGYVSGAGLVTRKELFKRAFSPRWPAILSDRKSNNLSTGGDVEYCLRLILLGYNIYYDEALQFRHFIPAHRLTETYRDAIFEGVKASRPILNKYFEAIKIKQLDNGEKIKLIAKASAGILKSMVRNREMQSSAAALFFFIFNLGYKKNSTMKIIKHFYDA